MTFNPAQTHTACYTFPMSNTEVVVCHCDESTHARGAETAACIYTAAGKLRPEYREVPADGAPRMSYAQRKRLAERSRSYSNAVRNYNH